jgi:hypothetical protein
MSHMIGSWLQMVNPILERCVPQVEYRGIRSLGCWVAVIVSCALYDRSWRLEFNDV